MHHPKHYLIFKYFIKEGFKKGWQFKILISKKDVLEELLKADGLDYEVIGENKPTIFKKVVGVINLTYNTFKFTKKFKPDIFMGRAFPHFSFVSSIMNKPYIIWEDTEHVKMLHRITVPFSDAVVTPESFKRDFGKKQIRINSYQELAYLHPNRFKPDISVIEELGLGKVDRYVILRFVSWNAHHDIGQSGLSLEDKKKLIKIIEKEGIIPLITSEGPLPKDFEKYRIRILPHRMHAALYYAAMYIGEGGTMASEAAVLGTPSIFISSLADKLGNFIELEKQYKLMWSFRNPEDAISKAKELIQMDDLKEVWKRRKAKMLKDKIDVTAFNLWFVENYPESVKIMKEQRDYQEKFK